MTRTPATPGRTSPRVHGTPPMKAALAGLVVCALVVGFVALVYIAPRGVPLTGTTTLYATLPDGGNLRVHSEVRVGGVRIGEVVSLTPAGGQARVRMRIDPGQREKIPAGTTAAVRGQGLLGARYLDLTPATTDTPVAEGATLAASSTPYKLGVGDALETFDRQTRGGMRTVLGELGRGLLGRGVDVNDALRVSPAWNRDVQALAAAVTARTGAVERFAPSVSEAVTALDQAREEIVAMLDPARRALEPFVDHGAELRETLDRFPPALAAARPALGEGERLLVATSSLARASRRTLAPAPAGLRAASRFLGSSPRPLQSATRLVDDARTAVPHVLRITRSAGPVVKPLGAAFDDLRPLVASLGNHACDLDAWTGNWRDFVNQGVAGGQGASGGVGIGPLTALRFTVAPSLEAVAGFGSNEGLNEDDDNYAAPCKYAPQTYPAGARP